MQQTFLTADVSIGTLPGVHLHVADEAAQLSTGQKLHGILHRRHYLYYTDQQSWASDNTAATT